MSTIGALTSLGLLVTQCAAVQRQDEWNLCANFTLFHDKGLHSASSKVVATLQNVENESSCCALCGGAKYPVCNSWTYHPKGSHPGEDLDCTLLRLDSLDPHSSPGAISGSTVSPAPAPPPKPPPVPPPLPAGQPVQPPLGFQPNFVFIITDDQDEDIGGLRPMPKTRELMQAGGTTFPHFYVNTPVCCPSRYVERQFYFARVVCMPATIPRWCKGNLNSHCGNVIKCLYAPNATTNINSISVFHIKIGLTFLPRVVCS